MTSDIQSMLERAQHLLRHGLLEQAREQTRQVLDIQPDNTSALYAHAVCLRYRGELEAALEVVTRLHELAPEYGRGYQEAGHIYRETGAIEEAIRAYSQATSLNPGLMASWKALAELQRAAGNEEAARQAQLNHDRLASLPAELVSVASMIHEGKLYKAERLCRSFLQKHSHHIEAMRLLAQIGAKLHVLDDAEFLLESCLVFQPEYHLARYDYVNVLHRRQKYAQALEQAEKLIEAQPGNPSFEVCYASQLMAVGRFEEALATYDRVLQVIPDGPNLHLVRGHALKTIGRTDEAIDAYRTAYRSKPDFGDAYWSLANLKTYNFNDAELEQMQSQEARRGTPLADRYHMCFALGKALEDRGEYGDAFKYYERGNRLKKAELRYDPDETEREFQRQTTICTDELLRAQEGQGFNAPDPIFIVGLPRAGSTLLEQILASHSQIDGTMELPHILAFAHRLSGRRRVGEEPRYPARLQHMTAEEFKALGEKYITETQLLRGNAPYFIDKMPNNFRHIGLIHLILPNARIIDARRDPMACCFSGFKQLFAEGQEFTYGLEEIGRYYKGYCELMDHWDAVLPGKVLRVRYEAVVSDLESQVERVLEFLGLPFEQACLDFHKTDRSVRTASSEQVRQPLYTSGIEQWRHFEPWLGPLKQVLGQRLERESRGKT